MATFGRLVKLCEEYGWGCPRESRKSLKRPTTQTFPQHLGLAEDCPPALDSWKRHKLTDYCRGQGKQYGQRCVFERSISFPGMRQSERRLVAKRGALCGNDKALMALRVAAPADEAKVAAMLK
jgi:hypothetical protein